MPAYLIAEHIVTDPAKFQEYLTMAGPMMTKHGARYLTKGSTHKLPEGAGVEFFDKLGAAGSADTECAMRYSNRLTSPAFSLSRAISPMVRRR